METHAILFTAGRLKSTRMKMPPVDAISIKMLTQFFMTLDKPTFNTYAEKQRARTARLWRPREGHPDSGAGGELSGRVLPTQTHQPVGQTFRRRGPGHHGPAGERGPLAEDWCGVKREPSSPLLPHTVNSRV